MEYTKEQIGFSTEQLARQANNFRALLERFDLTQNELAAALYTTQQTISCYVVGKRNLTERAEEDIIQFIHDSFGVNINPGFLRGVDDRMTLSVEETIDKGVQYWDADDAAENLIAAVGFTFQYDSTHDVYDMKENGRTVCEISSADKEKIISEVLNYAVNQSKKLIKHSRPK